VSATAGRAASLGTLSVPRAGPLRRRRSATLPPRCRPAGRALRRRTCRPIRPARWAFRRRIQRRGEA
jgi:hypothetical protein